MTFNSLNMNATFRFDGSEIQIARSNFEEHKETLQHGFHIQNDAEEHVRNLISNTVVWFMRDKNEIGRNLSTTGGGDSCAYVRCLIDLYVYQFGIETFNAAEYRIDSRTVACFRRKEDSYREKYAMTKGRWIFLDMWLELYKRRMKRIDQLPRTSIHMF
ncbi:unnamed protein product [Heterobilharzia americana]|nr:unnamed protein product [Heterobilharzia americana]